MIITVHHFRDNPLLSAHNFMSVASWPELITYVGEDKMADIKHAVQNKSLLQR